jgi:glycosyltransferase involved in cell wall biosynthesis
MLEGIRIMPMPKRRFGPTYGRTINKQIEKAVARLKPDLIHIHGMRPLEFLKPKSVPIVYTNHTSGFLKRLKKGGYRIPRLKRLFAPADLFLAPSEELLDMPFDIRAPKRFISNGIVPDRFVRNQDDRLRLRQQLQLAETDKLAIITRRMVEKNGVIYLARAMRHMKNRSLKLLFIGDGPEQEAIKVELDTHFAGHYTMLGAMSHAEIVPFYSAADLSILPSLMEATSISCLEAMAAGLPIICSNVGGLPFLVEDGVNGFLAEPADAQSLAHCLEQATWLDDMEAMGRRISVGP